MTSGWQTYSLAEIAQIQGGGTPSRKVAEYFGGDIPWATPTDLPPIGIVSTLNGTKERITQSGLYSSSAKLIDSGSVLFSSRASIGKIAVTDAPCATNQGFANFTPNPDYTDPWFLAFLLCRHTPKIRALGGKTTFLEVARKHLKSFKVQIPDIDEQRRIVIRIKECMERIDEIAELRTETISEARATLPSMLNGAFVELANKYDSVCIGDVVIESRYGTSRKCSTEPLGTPVLRIPNVRDGFVNTENLKYCDLDAKELSRLQLLPGDLLFVRTNGSRDLVGRCAIFEPSQTERRFAYASYLIRLRLDQEKILPHYLAFFLNSSQGRVELDERRRTSAGQFNINSENLKSIELPLPPIDVQLQLLEELQSIQSQVLQLQAEVISAQKDEAQLSSSVLNKAFSGEL